MSNTEVEFRAYCISEKQNISVCGALDLNGHWTKDNIDWDDVFISMGDCFWENASEFDEIIQKAIDDGTITGTDKDSLFQVFGHFYYSIEVDGNKIAIEPDRNPDEFMYSHLKYI